MPAPSRVRAAGPDDADVVHAVIAAAFGARPPLDPPSAALAETVETVRDELAAYGGLLAEADGRAAGALLFAPGGGLLGLRRFGVVPDAQRQGVAGALVAAADRHAEALGLEGLSVVARVELPGTVRFWERQGFAVTGWDGVDLHLLRLRPRVVHSGSAEATGALAERLAGMLSAGDLLILTGDLGAGKTTFTRGLGRGLGVRGEVTSPTFVIARVHPSLGAGPALVHVDAYRLGGVAELDDLDLDASLDEAVTVVEWGSGLAEGLAGDRLEVEIARGVGSAGGDDRDPRRLTFRPVGRRWAGVLGGLLQEDE